MARPTDPIQILGGGPAGLAAGYYARRSGLAFHVYEAADRVGGNCRTLRIGDFRFDTGAHRLHDKDPEVTTELRSLLGPDLLRVDAPSQIFRDGRFIDFPLSVASILSALDAATLARVVGENLLRLARTRPRPENFRELAVGTYGRTLAEMFLLNYSEKLWGEDTARLSTAISGGRLRNLDLKNFLIDALPGSRRPAAHLDGSFYYPRYGIGMIADRVAEAIGAENISCGARITGLVHDGCRIQRIRIGRSEIDAGTVLSSLPLTRVLPMLEPAPPREIAELGSSIRFRHLVLGVLCIDRPRFTDNASIYFPGEDTAFTRIYESKNRSEAMAPPGQTSIVVEIPCWMDDDVWRMEEPALERELVRAIAATGLLDPSEVLEFRRFRVPFAYPVLETGHEARVQRIIDWLERFDNLQLIGRSARFRYTHIHDMFGMAREAVRSIEAGRAAPLRVGS